MKRNIWIGIGVVVAVALSLVLIVTQTKKEPKEIKIGAILPLTGSAAPYGQNAQRGTNLAISELAYKPSKYKFEIVFQDSKTEPKEAVNALRHLYNTEKIRYIIGDINSTGVLAMAPIAEKNKILLLSPGASNPDISYAGDWIFRNWHSDALEGQVAANFAFNKLGWKTAAVLYVNAAYGAGLAKTFKSVFDSNEGKIVGYEAYPQDATDMRTQIVKILDSKPDGLYLPGWPKEMSVALKQLKEMNSTLPILSAQGFDDPSILELAGDAAEGVIFSVPQVPDTNNPVVKKFNKKYKEKYGRSPGVCSASGYDALRIYAWAIDSVGNNPEKVRNLMANLKDFPGADGPITFDEHGDLLKPFMFKTVKDGKFNKYYTVP